MIDGRPKVIVLEDDDLRFDVKSQLQNHKMNCHITSSKNRFIAMNNKNDYDACVIDIKLSTLGTEGLEALQELRYEKPNMYIEVLTAFGEYKAQALDMGADMVSLKPNDVDGLALRIKKGILFKSLPRPATDFQFLDSFSGFLNNESLLNGATIIRTKYLGNCINEINNFIDEHKVSEVAALEMDELKYGILQILMRELVVDSRKEVLMNEHTMNQGDKNMMAFFEMKDWLVSTYKDEYVAFVDGEFQFSSANLRELHERVDKTFPDKKGFLAKVDSGKTVHFRGPRRIYRS